MSAVPPPHGYATDSPATTAGINAGSLYGMVALLKGLFLATLNVTLTGTNQVRITDGTTTVLVDATTASLNVNVKRTKTLKRAAGQLSGSGDNTAIAAVVGKVLKVYQYSLQGTGTVNAKLTDGAAGTALTGTWNFQAREGCVSPFAMPEDYLFATSQGNALVLNLSAAVGCNFEITYTDDDAS